MGLKDTLKALRHRFLRATGLPQQWERTFAERSMRELSYVDRGSQIALAMKYREEFVRQGKPMAFDDVEFRNHSQNGEDGILWYLFSLLGTTNKRCVEICAGDGTENNCANLIVNHGWTGLLFDGNTENVSRGKDYFGRHPDTRTFPPKFVHAWVTAENVNTLIGSNGLAEPPRVLRRLAGLSQATATCVA